MDRVSQFRVDGDLSLKVPLDQGFEKVLYDFVEMTIAKSGFDGEDCDRIARQILGPIQEKMKGAHRKKADVQVSLVHSPGQVIARTTIQELSFSKEQKFRARTG